jgi:hypothetical protein
MTNWRGFEDLADQAVPFIWRAARTSLGKVKLD